MKIVLATISPRRGGMSGAFAELVQLYTERSARYIACEQRSFASEARLLAFLEEAVGDRFQLTSVDDLTIKTAIPEQAEEIEERRLARSRKAKDGNRCA